MFGRLIADQLCLLCFKYSLDSSFYTGLGFAPSEIVDQQGNATVPFPDAKISIHGSGKILGPDRHEAHAIRPDDHLGFELRKISGRVEICQHHLASSGAYVAAFDTRRYARETDAFWEGILETPGAHFLQIEVAPDGHDITDDQWVWRTCSLGTDRPLLIIANARNTGAEFPPHDHQVRIPVNARR